MTRKPRRWKAWAVVAGGTAVAIRRYRYDLSTFVKGSMEIVEGEFVEKIPQRKRRRK